jgi:hypothetical protein
MTTPSPFIKRLKLAATKAAARAATAKTQVRAAKAQLKQARKLFKVEKKAAKHAWRKVDAAAVSATRRTPRPAANLKLKPAVRKPGAKPVLAARKRPKSAPKAAPKITPKRPPKKNKPRRAAKARVPAVPGMRSAAEVAKSVIERLHAPPPILPPEPVLPTAPAPSPGDSTT